MYPSCQCAVVDYLDILLHGCPSDSAGEIYLDTCGVRLRKCEPCYSAPRSGRRLGLDTVVGKLYAVISRVGRLACLVVVRPIAADTSVLFTGYRMKRPGSRHDQEVAEIAVPAYTAHLSQGKTLDSGVLMAVARSVVTSGNGVRTYLHHTERGGSSRKCLAQAVICAGTIHVGTRSYKRIDIRHRCARYRCNGSSG